MSASQSNLSNDKYGYDLVVATTQESINNTTKHFLLKLQNKSPLIGRFEVTYYKDNQEQKKEVTYAELKEQFTDGRDLFDIPNHDKTSEVFDILEKNNVDEITGFTAKLGLPKKNWNIKENNIIEFLNHKEVMYRMTCHEMSILSYTTSRHGFEWSNNSQGDSENKKPWIFDVKVPLKEVAHEHGGLPDDVTDGTSKLTRGTFSVQKLLLDLDKCFLHEAPTIEGVEKESDVYNFLLEHFVDGYVEELKENGGVILDYKVKHFKKPENSTLFITAIDLNSKLNADNPKISTLCYLGTTDGKSPKSLSEFDWTWVDNIDTAGVIAINRKQFARIIANEILPTVKSCCFDVGARVWHTGLNLHYKISANWNNEPDSITYPSTGTTVTEMKWSSSAYDKGGMSSLKVTCDFDTKIKFDGKHITVIRHLKFFIKIDNSDSKKGHPVDTTITDVFDLAIDKKGMIVLLPNSTKTEKNGKPLPDHWWSGVNNVADSFTKWVDNLADSELGNIDLNSMGKFYFPGGNVFAFENPRFSNSQDLISEISYVNPIAI